MIGIGRLLGLLLEFCILVQLILIGRIRWIDRALAYDKMIGLHKTIGLTTLIALIGHPLLLVMGYGNQANVPWSHQFLYFIQDWEDVILAVIGVLLMIVAITVSIRFIRNKLKYERWHALHLLMYAGIALAFMHQIQSGDVSRQPALWYWLGLNFSVFGLFILFRFIRPLYLFWKHDFRVKEIVKETEDVWSIIVSGKNIADFKFESGQFANIFILQKGLWSPHPFSFSSAPNGKTLRFTMKALGDFTSKIESIKIGARVLIDGPHGRFISGIARTDKYLFLAGGIGITPIRAIIESLAEQKKNFALLYANKNASTLAFKEEIESLIPSANAPYCYVLSEEQSVNHPMMQSGMIDQAKIESLVPDFRERDIYICGPGPMIMTMRKLLQDLGVPKTQIHYELFKT